MKKSFILRRDDLSETSVDAHIFSRRSHRVEIKVIPFYLEDESAPMDQKYVWAYHVQIYNNRPKAVKLLKRVWNITDGMGVTREVRGEGVTGEQPIIEPDSVFEYTSAVPLTTPTGFMAGFYEMVDIDGHDFSAKVPTFSLDSPHVPSTLL